MTPRSFANLVLASLGATATAQSITITTPVANILATAAGGTIHTATLPAGPQPVGSSGTGQLISSVFSTSTEEADALLRWTALTSANSLSFTLSCQLSATSPTAATERLT